MMETRENKRCLFIIPLYMCPKKRTMFSFKKNSMESGGKKDEESSD